MRNEYNDKVLFRRELKLARNKNDNLIWRSSSVGESTRFIPVVSAVQIRPSLLKQMLQFTVTVRLQFFCINF